MKPINQSTPRQLRAEMILRDLALGDVATGAKINYTVACQILKGRRNDAVRLAALQKVIFAHPRIEVLA